MTNSLAVPILGAASAYGMLAVFALFGLSRGNRRANRYLALFTLLIVFSVVLHAFHYVGQTRVYPHLHLLYSSFGFLYGPLLYFHIGALTDPAGSWSVRKWLRGHSWPFFLFVSYQIPFLILSSAGKLEVIHRGYMHWPHDTLVSDLLQNLSIGLYLCLSATLVVRFKGRKDDSDLVHLAVYRWSWALLVYVSIGLAFAVVEVVSSNFFDVWIVPFICVGFFGLTGYFWFLFPEAFVAILPTTDGSKYQRSGLKPQDVEKFEKKLLLVMESERPYLEASLSMKELAGRVGLNEVYLSQIINERTGKSFFEFVNGYRVQEAVRRLGNLGGGKTMLDVGYEAGFNSKSTFYSAFKKETGLTPGEYLKQRGPKAP